MVSVMSIEQVTAFFGWCSVINIGFLWFTALMLIFAGDWAKGIHSRMFKVKKEDLGNMYFNYLAYMKLLIIVFNVVPWLALKIMG